MSVKEARLILGKTKNHRRHRKILLKTCFKNSRNCDYIGLGPYQFTTTKTTFKSNFRTGRISFDYRTNEGKNIQIPFMPLEVTLEHVESLMKTGIHGIAVSGLITQTENASQLIKQQRQIICYHLK
jgi:thiamine-phosphate pyrophosphorylase